MATGGQISSQPEDPATSHNTHCPLCGLLCLGHCVLPCGHLTCRKCFRNQLKPVGKTTACRQCGHQLTLHKDQELTVSQLARQMWTDPVLELQVREELEKEEDPRCVGCPNKQAVSVCVDCREYFCQHCSALHHKFESSNDHDLLLLPQALQNTSSAAQVSHRRPSVSDVSTSSVDSIRYVDDPQSRGRSRDVKEWEAWIRKMEDLLQQEFSEQLEVKKAMQHLVSEGQQLLNRTDMHQQTLGAYLHHLPRLHVTQRTDTGTYVIQVPSSDVTMEVNTEILERRLCDVMKCCQPPDVKAVERIRTQLRQLLHPPDQGKNSAGSTPVTPATSLLSSSTPSTPTSPPLPPSPQPATPTSPPLPPSPQPATPTFTPRVDLMTAVPRRMFTVSSATADDTDIPWITAMVRLPDDRLVMADRENSKVKVIESTPPHTLSSLELTKRPRRLAVLPDGLVAMTTLDHVIYLIRVTDTMTVTSRIQTDRRYDGIAGHSEGHLIASCSRRGTQPATVDLLTRQGDMLRTLTDSSRLPDLQTPLHISNAGDEHHILLSDWDTHVVHELDIRTGDVVHTFRHVDMKKPIQVCVHPTGGMLVVSYGGHCVLVRDREGQWRKLVTAREHSDQGYVRPKAVCLTSSGHLVVAWEKMSGECIVIGYTLD